MVLAWSVFIAVVLFVVVVVAVRLIDSKWESRPARLAKRAGRKVDWPEAISRLRSANGYVVEVESGTTKTLWWLSDSYCDQYTADLKLIEAAQQDGELIEGVDRSSLEELRRDPAVAVCLKSVSELDFFQP